MAYAHLWNSDIPSMLVVTDVRPGNTAIFNYMDEGMP